MPCSSLKWGSHRTSELRARICRRKSVAIEETVGGSAAPEIQHICWTVYGFQRGGIPATNHWHQEEDRRGSNILEQFQKEQCLDNIMHMVFLSGDGVKYLNDCSLLKQAYWKEFCSSRTLPSTATRVNLCWLQWPYVWTCFFPSALQKVMT